MNKGQMNELVALLYRGVGPKRILIALAKIEAELSREHWATMEHWYARDNAKLLRATAERLRGRGA